MIETVSEDTENDIAIIGMACRFPGAATPDEFWSNLVQGKESLTELSDDILLKNGVSKQKLEDPRYVKAGMFLDGFDHFDADFFGFSPLDAKILDPQHRHFLECSWEAFEDAGYNPEKYEGAVGVFAGSGQHSYLSSNLLNNPKLVEEIGLFLLRHTGNDKDFLATRVSYLLNLKGPSVNVQSACSTSLVAVHMGAQSLLNAECDMVLAGGVTIELAQQMGYEFKESEILSPDGHCRPFDASAQGTVFGSGVGCVILKRYQDAVDDGDNIHAVVKATAINNDGAGKVSYLAPGVDGQSAAVTEALTVGDIDPKSVSYIECHGTGTVMGDPIEVAALSQAYSIAADDDEQGSQKQWCGIGSVKSNIGHTDTAAGIASLIKVVQSLKNKQLAPTLHYQSPNPAIRFSDSPFYVNSELNHWDNAGPRRAAVSSLGVGGTNAHVILQEANPVESERPAGREQLVLLSAKSDQALHRYAGVLAEHLEGESHVNIEDVCYTLAVGRKSFSKRSFTVAKTLSELTATLDAPDQTNTFSAEAPRDPLSIAFMFAGGGSQFQNMGRDLYQTEAVYRQAVDECFGFLQEFTDFDLKTMLYCNADAHHPAVLEAPSRALPALFITQYAQAMLWKSWGVEPEAMIGHSMGENTAACLSGVMSLRSAIGLVALRGRLFESVAAGGMLSVSLGQEALEKYTQPLDLDVAAANAPELSVASGPSDVLNQLQQMLTENNIDYQRIHIDVAAHSRMLTPILQPFKEYLQSITLQAPAIPFISNISGDWITDEQACSADYWVDHLRQTVLFEDGIGKLLHGNKYALLEAGPGKTLSSLSRMHGEYTADHIVETSLPAIDDPRSARNVMLHALGKLWLGGAEIDWPMHFTEGSRISLPTYQFDHRRHWVEPELAVASTIASRVTDTSGWLYQPTWQRMPAAANQSASVVGKCVLHFSSQDDVAMALEGRLQDSGAEVIRVTEGVQFIKLCDTSYVIDLSQPNDYQRLLEDLVKSGRQVSYLVHSLALSAEKSLTIESSRRDTMLCFDSLFYCAKACITEDVSHAMRWLVVSQGAQQLAGEPVLNPHMSLINGPVKVIAAENPAFQCCSADLPVRIENLPMAVDALLTCLSDNDQCDVIALRGNARYAANYQLSITDNNSHQRAPSIVENGVYIITGGTGDLGMVAANAIAATQQVNLVLVSRTPLPDRSSWVQLLESGCSEAKIIDQIQAMEANGSTVVHCCADVASVEDLSGVRDFVLSKFGQLNGIVHTAGLVEDNLIALKSIDESDRVFNPKVRGTLALASVFDISSLDFMVLYSSVSALRGLAGQIDYCAANAFLDSFAHYCAAQGWQNVTSVNWPAWTDAGIAARLVLPAKAVPLSGEPAMHPLLDFCVLNNDSVVEYQTELSVDKFWMLDEHRLKDGKALIPGSGFIEIARAAFCEATGFRSVSISNATFLQPFSVSDNTSSVLAVELKCGAGKTLSNGADFTICCLDGDKRTVHVTGFISTVDLKSTTLNYQEILQHCDKAKQKFDDPDHHPHLKFGQRWASLRQVDAGDKDAVIELSLEAQYANDLKDYALHPALLDMAAGGAQILIPGYQPGDEFFVPVEYGELNFSGDFTADSFSHVKLKDTSTPQSTGTAIFDISVCDADGHVFLTIEDFVMQRLPTPQTLSDSVSFGSVEGPDEINPVLSRTLELGIDSTEGAIILNTIMAGSPGPQVAVSAFDLKYLLDELTMVQQGSGRSEESLNTPRVAHDPDADEQISMIESELLEHDAIDLIVIRSHLNDNGSRRYVAHFKTDDWDGITISELRKFSRSKLDKEFVPQHYVEIDEIPQTDSGEIDRTALIDPFAPVDHFIAPRTEIEKGLAAIWSEVLGADKISLTDNFFDIGGHSLLSIRVIVRAQKKFQVQLDQAKMVLLTLEQVADDIQSQLPDSPEQSGGEVADLDTSPELLLIPEKSRHSSGQAAGYMNSIRGE